MASNLPSSNDRFGPALPAKPLAGFVVGAIAVLAICALSFFSLANRSTNYERITFVRTVLSELDAVLGALQDAETGQRGFLLTGDIEYLRPYHEARRSVQAHLTTLGRFELTPVNVKRLDALNAIVKEKLAELDETIDAHRAGDTDRALAIVRSNRGRDTMDGARALIAEIKADKQAQLVQREEEWQRAALVSFVVTGGGSVLLLVLIVLAATMTSRQARADAMESWLKAGVAGLSDHLQGDPRIDVLSKEVLSFLCRYLGAQLGLMYTMEEGRLRRQAGYALPAEAGRADEWVDPGAGIVGQSLYDGSIRTLAVPDAYFDVGSGLGRARPKHLLVAPMSTNRRVNSVVEFAFFREVHASDTELLRRVSEHLAAAVEAANSRSRLEELLEETQRQTEELQTQQEELRVANEELEEQASRLRDSQARLESQHAELEQINSQLGEQTRSLEAQKDELARAQSDLGQYTDELTRAYKYKTEFLANMSHELRTPLNSTLILAKLLADNKGGNLTDEQVSFARTILSAGNDLLELINDILDLSKIEAGKVEVNWEPVVLRDMLEPIVRNFEAIAQQKEVRFSFRIEAGVPERLTTDRHRLGQILRNLLANALKFTERGEVEVTVTHLGPTGVAIHVRDTGIGIAADQLDAVFEAFRQGDGSTHRKYGGTGLGLSISRRLARLLGGDIEVRSVLGNGSTFTLRLPRDGTVASEAPATATSESGIGLVQKPVPLRAERGQDKPSRPTGELVRPPSLRVDDDRDRLHPGARVLLIVEDDVAFAAVLRDLAHELGFQAILAHDASTGIAAARSFPVHAIVLDMQLPDRSGLEVLDELKREPLTRHIPIHVVSVEDYSQEALSRGAIGYAIKPVLREQLAEALHKLEVRFTQQLRRVLVVEDDARQRDSIRLLLSADGVEIVDAPTAAVALETLQRMTFDCMVLDLNLPDLSGYELLEQMAGSENVAFPPVIVYTGRTLARDEEQRLRRYSRAIIIKDARSPERLMDEVSLFLHQVESTLPPERQRELRQLRDREAAFEGRRVLIAEDDVRNIFALTKVLEPKGAHVVIARNGREALERLAEGARDPSTAIDIVLMDIMMPEMDGLTAMREIRANAAWKRLPIIALTAKAMRDDRDLCLQAGANDYIAKPLDIERLLSLVRVWMPR